MNDIRLPNITANTADGQLQQIKSYMYQLVEQLNWALETVNSASNGSTANVDMSGTSENLTEEEAQNTFNSIKALIIKSADIVNAYYEEMKVEYDGEYVAKSDYGTFTENTNNTLIENSTAIKNLYTNLQTVISDVKKIIDTSAWTKSGLLGYDEEGAPIYGFEVGQKNIINGIETFNRYARFTANGIYFYLPGINDPVAWMSGTKLFISNAEITGELKIAGFKIVKQNGLAFKWVGD